MNVRDATVQALARRFGISTAPGLRSGTDTVRGQKARLGAIDRAYGGRKGAAAAIGVTADTLTRWKTGKRKVSKASQDKIGAAYDKLQADKLAERVRRAQAAEAKKPPKTITAVPGTSDVTVTATIRWTRSDRKKYNASPHRTTTLTSIPMGPVVAAWLAGADPGAELERQASIEYAVTANGGIGFEGDDVEIRIH